MRVPLALAATLAVALLAVPGALAERAFTDPAGDAGTAPDITAVRVSHDASVVSIALTTNAAALSDETTFWGYIDTDANAATGFPAHGVGAELFFLADADGGLLARLVGNSLVFDFNSGLSTSFTGGVFTVRLNRQTFGTVERFAFAMESELEDANGDTIASDLAPDGPPFYGYSFVPLVLTVDPVSAAPKAPAAGKPLVLSARVGRSDGQPFTAGTVACRARVGAAAIRTTPSVAGGLARCSLRVPKTARGKQLRGSITVSAEDSAPVTRPFTLRVR